MTALAKRYARAAVELVDERRGPEGLQELDDSLASFVRALAASEELRELIANPALRPQRQQVLGEVLQKLRVVEPAKRLILLLAEHDRLPLLDDVTREVCELADAQLGRVRARVRTAIPLSDTQAGRLERALEARFQKPIVLQIEIDPSIIGGLVCEAGDVRLDSSIRRHLSLLRERLLG